MTDLITGYLMEVIMSTLKEKRGDLEKSAGRRRGYILLLSL